MYFLFCFDSAFLHVLPTENFPQPCFLIFPDFYVAAQSIFSEVPGVSVYEKDGSDMDGRDFGGPR